MANEQNLKALTTEKAREIGAKGGKASAEARRKKRDLRLALEMLLESDMKAKDGTIKSGAEVITAKLFEQAKKGNVKAFETIRSTVGQDPAQKVEVTAVNRDECRKELEELFNE